MHRTKHFTNAPITLMRFTRFTIGNGYSATSLAWRQAGKKHLLEPCLSEIVIVVACNPNPVSLHFITKVTGASPEYLLKRIADLIQQGYLTKGTHPTPQGGPQLTGYNLGPNGVQFFSDYKTYLRQVKKQLLAG